MLVKYRFYSDADALFGTVYIFKDEDEATLFLKALEFCLPGIHSVRSYVSCATPFSIEHAQEWLRSSQRERMELKDSGDNRRYPIAPQKKQPKKEGRDKTLRRDDSSSGAWCGQVFIHDRLLGGRPIRFINEQQCQYLLEVLLIGFERRFIKIRTLDGATWGQAIPYSPKKLWAWLDEQTYFPVSGGVLLELYKLASLQAASHVKSEQVAYRISVGGRLICNIPLIFERRETYVATLALIKKFTSSLVLCERVAVKTGKILTREMLYCALKAIPDVDFKYIGEQLGIPSALQPSSPNKITPQLKNEESKTPIPSCVGPGAHPRPWEWARDDGVTCFNPFDYK